MSNKYGSRVRGSSLDIFDEADRLMKEFSSVPSTYEEMFDIHAPGAKADQGKPRLALVLDGFSKALVEVGKVGTFGAEKYSDNGWKHVENARGRYRDALYRHLFADSDRDEESGLLHLSHAAWNVLALLSLEMNDEIEKET